MRLHVLIGLVAPLHAAGCSQAADPAAARQQWLRDRLVASNWRWIEREPALVAGKLALMAETRFDYVRGTDGLFWDREATHTNDLDSYFPVHRLQEYARDGRFAGLAQRLHGVPTEYSQRQTLDRDAPELLRRCQDDGVDAALLVPL